ncbi:MAG: S9 family peptidase [Planctomycetes bacterium]|nr:S9 family peptidase [Planctomycetota bacterium]
MRLMPVAAVIVTTFLALTVSAEEPHPFTVHDLVVLKRISDPQVSPDGKWIVYVLRTTDLEANKGRTDLWLVSSDGATTRRLTAHEAADNNPRWSADGRSIYFLSTRSGSSQVWKISVAGGEAEQVTKLPLDVSSLVVSGDGKHLAFSMEVFPGTSPEDTQKRLDEQAKRKATGRVYDKLFFRHWDSWKDGRRNHVFVMPVGGGDSVDVMKEMDADAPSKPFGGTEEIAFTPDGTSVVFCARYEGSSESWSTNLDLWIASLDGSGKPARLTESNKALDGSPQFSPDGKTLVYKAMSRPGYEADRQRIMVRDGVNGKDREVAPGWDHSAGDMCWSEDGKTLFVAAEHIGQNAIFAMDVATGKDRIVVGQGACGSPSIAGNRLIYTMHHLAGPTDIYSVNFDGSDNKPITRVNADRLAKIQFGEPEQFSFTGAGGDKVYGYVVKPVGLDEKKKYPVAFLIHGGPQGSFGNDFHYRWNPQTYAGAGYAAVMVDFHGSTGYGQAFCDAIRGDWGGKPLEDLQKGLAAALKQYPWMDGDRVAALGASYGGYMINWIAGNWPDGFKCLVCHDGNLDERMAYYDTEELWFPEWDHMGTPWDKPEHYEKHNPQNYVKNWKTPMLVIHGGQDFRVVETQGMSTFTALQRRGIPSKFLYFPDENHWVLKPANSILWHETVLGWLDQWTKKP